MNDKFVEVDKHLSTREVNAVKPGKHPQVDNFCSKEADLTKMTKALAEREILFLKQLRVSLSYSVFCPDYSYLISHTVNVQGRHLRP